MYISYYQTDNARPVHTHNGKQIKRITSHNKLIRCMVLITLFLFSVTFGVFVHAAYAGNMETVQGYSSTSSSIAKTAKSVSSPTLHIESSQTLIVGEGNTLWTIAASNCKKGTDIRLYIQQIKKLNSLKSSSLQVGQVLTLP